MQAQLSSVDSEKSLWAEKLRVLWLGFELESDGQSAVHCSCAELSGLKGGARTTKTTCCRPPSSPQQFVIMATYDCKHVARALCSQSWCVSSAELLTSLVATGPAWILSLLPSSLLSPTEPCHSHPVPTSNHRGGENSVCLPLYPNILTLILKALRHWESGQLLWSCKCHLEEEHLAPLWLLPAPSQVS